MKSFKITYKNTHYYLFKTEQGILAFDAGWPGTYSEYKNELKKQRLDIKNITWLIISHFHIDHAGLVGQMVKNGVACVVFPRQKNAIAEMEHLMQRKQLPHLLINTDALKEISFEHSEKWLKSIGIDGKIIPTNGHTDHCITLILDTGEVYIGDLPVEGMYLESDKEIVESWKRIKANGGKFVKPAHAQEYRISSI